MYRDESTEVTFHDKVRGGKAGWTAGEEEGIDVTEDSPRGLEMGCVEGCEAWKKQGRVHVGPSFDTVCHIAGRISTRATSSWSRGLAVLFLGCSWWWWWWCLVTVASMQNQCLERQTPRWPKHQQQEGMCGIIGDVKCAARRPGSPVHEPATPTLLQRTPGRRASCLVQPGKKEAGWMTRMERLVPSIASRTASM